MSPSGVSVTTDYRCFCVKYAGLIVAAFLFVGKPLARDYIHFQNHATEHVLMRKVVGDYIFVHRLLLEYFAILDTTDNAVEQKQPWVHQ